MILDAILKANSEADLADLEATLETYLGTNFKTFFQADVKANLDADF